MPCMDITFGCPKCGQNIVIENPMTTYDKLKQIIVEQLGVKPEDVAPEKRFEADLGADSLDAIELAIAAEEEFDLIIDDADAENVRTVAEAVTFVYRLMMEQRMEGNERGQQ